MRKTPVPHFIISILIILLANNICRAAMCDTLFLDTSDTLAVKDTIKCDSIVIELQRDTTVSTKMPRSIDSLNENTGILRQQSKNMLVFSYKNLRHYLLHNISYPAQAYYEGIEGTVLVEFIIETDGTIGEVKAVQPIHPLLDAEAIRLVKNMPRWVPLKLNGEPVRVSHTIPVIFEISESDDQE